MAVQDYSPPVSNLFEIGEPRDYEPKRWRDYRENGLGPADVPDLIRLVRDWPAHWRTRDASAESQHFWAPVHAWRALAQLGAAEAVGPLLEVLTVMQADVEEGDDWTAEDFAEVFAMIGPAAVPALDAYLAEAGRPLYALTEVSRGLRRLALRHRAERDRVVDVLTRAMSRYEQNLPELNGFILGDLLELNAAEAAPVIREAFRAGRVDETIAGGWGEVRTLLDLTPQPDDPPEVSVRDAMRARHPKIAALQESILAAAEARAGSKARDEPAAPAAPFVPPKRAIDRQQEKERARRKQAKAARKQNRRRGR